MGKGTIIISRPFDLLCIRDASLTGEYTGHVYVSCNDGTDPTEPSPYPVVQRPLPPGIKTGDFVTFEHIPVPGTHRNRRVVRIIGLANPDDCAREEIFLKVTLFEEKNGGKPPKKNPAKPKKVKKAPKKKAIKKKK